MSYYTPIGQLIILGAMLPIGIWLLFLGVSMIREIKEDHFRVLSAILFGVSFGFFLIGCDPGSFGFV